jgi:dinuclear metal center YbgI/SA1388 family protein
MKVKELISLIEKDYPLSFQESYDKSGGQIVFPESEITGVLITLDVREDIIKEAIEKNCNVVISHHPMFFKGINSIYETSETGKNAILAIQNNVSIYSMHTNFDNSWEGTNKILAEVLDLKNLEILSPFENALRKIVTFVPQSHVDVVREAIFKAGAGVIGNYDCCSYNVEGYGTFRANEDANPFVGEKGKIHKEPEVRIETIFPAYLESVVIESLLNAHPYEEVAYDIYPLINKHYRAGTGIIGYLSEPMSKDAFLWYVKDKIGTKVLKYNNCTKQLIQKIALCTGSGSTFVNKAIQKNADVYITADVSYHYFADNNNILIIDAGHFETEIFFVKKIFDYLTKKNYNFAVQLSENCVNPVNYF